MLDSPRWALTRRKLARGAFVIDQKELRQLATGADLDPKAFAKQMRSLNVKLNAKELGMLFCAFDNDGDGTVAAKEFAKHLSDVKTEEKTKRERLAREDNSYFLERKLEREAAVVAKHRKQAQVAVAATWSDEDRDRGLRKLEAAADEATKLRRKVREAVADHELRGAPMRAAFLGHVDELEEILEMEATAPSPVAEPHASSKKGAWRHAAERALKHRRPASPTSEKAVALDADAIQDPEHLVDVALPFQLGQPSPVAIATPRSIELSPSEPAATPRPAPEPPATPQRSPEPVATPPKPKAAPIAPPEPAPAPATVTPSRGERRCVVVRAFVAHSPNELSVNEGDVVLVPAADLAKFGSLVYARKTDGSDREGYVPHKFVREGSRR